MVENKGYNGILFYLWLKEAGTYFRTFQIYEKGIIKLPGFRNTKSLSDWSTQDSLY